MKPRVSVQRLVVVLIGMLTVVGHVVLAQPDSTRPWQALTGDLEQLRQELALPGMSVAVLLDQQVVYARGFGLADIDREVAATESTPYHIASLTKPFSAVLVMRLVEAGLLSLDSRMRDLCAESVFIVNDEEVHGYDTLCEKLVGLINHPCAEYDFTLRHHLSHTARGVPGERYRYTGWLFGLVTEAVEAVTRRDFADLLAQEITGPLGLSSTVPNLSAVRTQQVLDQRALPYRIVGGNRHEFSRFPSHIRASAGMVSTVLDLARFDIAIDRNELLTQASSDTMWNPMTLNDGSIAPYGLGWYVQDLDAVGRVYWHAGWQPDMYSGLYLKVPTAGATFLMLANSDGASASFDLSLGDVRRSPFAQRFLELLVELR
ncbi:MAG: beta-lactamase family protein [Gemmatimonadota bacterium]|nr:MAG: beta-lactamase family protein [Gemmatimonadota bacterium]